MGPDELGDLLVGGVADAVEQVEPGAQQLGHRLVRRRADEAVVGPSDDQRGHVQGREPVELTSDGCHVRVRWNSARRRAAPAEQRGGLTGGGVGQRRRGAEPHGLERRLGPEDATRSAAAPHAGAGESD